MKTVDNDNLDSLPNGAVIKTDHGIYMRNKPRLFPGEWCWVKQGNVETYPQIHLRRPAEVLYNPDAPEHYREVVAVHEGHGEEAWCPTCEERWPCCNATVERVAAEALQATDEEVRAATNRVAAAIVEQMEPELDWDTMPSEDRRELYREVARAAIQALVSGPEQDQLRRLPRYPTCATCDGGGCGDCV